MTHTTSGTLVIAAAMRNGFIVAADSRRSIDQTEYFDGQKKIHFLKDRNDLAFFATNHTVFLAGRPPEHANMPMIEWVKIAPKKYDAINTIYEYINSSALDLLNGKYINDMSEFCRLHPSDALAQDRFLAYPPQGQTRIVYRMACIQYDKSTDQRLVGSFAINDAGSFGVTISDCGYNVQPSENLFAFWPFGESDYLHKQVLHGGGIDFLSKRALTLIKGISYRKINHVNEKDAILFSSSLISAASRYSVIKPSASRIGGEIFVYRVNGQDDPSIPLSPIL